MTTHAYAALLGTVSALMLGCASVEKTEAPIPPREIFKVGQIQQQRDPITNQLIYVFCRLDECVPSPKAITITQRPTLQPTSQRPTAPVKEIAPKAPSPIRVPFTYDDSKLNDGAIAVLTQYKSQIISATSIRLTGVADNYKRTPYNTALANRRAQSVRDWIDAAASARSRPQITVDARTVAAPAPHTPPAGEPLDGRRVDVLILELGGNK